MKKILYLSVIALTMFSCGQKTPNGADEQAQADSIARADSIAQADSIAKAKAEADSIARVDSIAKADSIAKVEKAKAKASKNSAKIEKLLKDYNDILNSVDPNSASTAWLNAIDQLDTELNSLKKDMTPEQKARYKKLANSVY